MDDALRRGISRAEYGPRPLAGRLTVPPKCRLSVIASLPRRDSTSVAEAGCKQGTRPLSSSSPLYCVARELERSDARFRVASSSLDRGLGGARLAQTTQELSRRLGVGDVELVPASDEPSETRMLLEDGRVLHFQEWYVREGAEPELGKVRLAGGAASRTAIHAIEDTTLWLVSEPWPRWDAPMNRVRSPPATPDWSSTIS